MENLRERKWIQRDENRTRDLEVSRPLVGKIYRAFLLLILFPFHALQFMGSVITVKCQRRSRLFPGAHM